MQIIYERRKHFFQQLNSTYAGSHFICSIFKSTGGLVSRILHIAKLAAIDHAEGKENSHLHPRHLTYSWLMSNWPPQTRKTWPCRRNGKSSIMSVNWLKKHFRESNLSYLMNIHTSSRGRVENSSTTALEMAILPGMKSLSSADSQHWFIVQMISSGLIDITRAVVIAAMNCRKISAGVWKAAGTKEINIIFSGNYFWLLEIVLLFSGRY